MLRYITINKIAEDGSILQYDACSSKADAIIRVAELDELGFKDAFYVEHPVEDITWYVADPANKTITMDSAAKLAVEQTQTVTAIKAECQRRIYARYPQTVQNNALARAIELADIKRERSLTAEEAQEEAALRAIRAWIKSMRNTSNQLEIALEDPAQEFPADFTAAEHWPA